MPDQKERAQQFLELHRGPQILILPNVWDAASARVVEAEGFPALATSSAGLANTLGYRDGERIPLDDLLWMVRRITRVVQAPVSVDFESGFAETPEHAAANCRRLLDAGVVGINLEDGTRDPAKPLTDAELQVEKIRAIRATAAAAGISFVINARTDIFLRAVGPEETRFDRAVERLLQYRQAGADCLFIPGVTELPAITRFVAALHAPVNILATAGAPSILQLKQAGVARVSFGSGPMRATMGLLQRIAREAHQSGEFGAMLEHAIPYRDANALFPEN